MITGLQLHVSDIIHQVLYVSDIIHQVLYVSDIIHQVLYVSDIIHQVLYDFNKLHTLFCNIWYGMWCHTTPISWETSCFTLKWDISTLEMKEADSSEWLVSVYPTTLHSNSEDCLLQIHCHEDRYSNENIICWLLLSKFYYQLMHKIIV